MPSPTDIKEARHRAGLTQSQAAALVGVQPRAWRYWEQEDDLKGTRQMPISAWEIFLIKSGTAGKKEMNQIASKLRRAADSLQDEKYDKKFVLDVMKILAREAESIDPIKS